jgi:L,D-transpeptidase catalytic domain
VSYGWFNFLSVAKPKKIDNVSPGNGWGMFEVKVRLALPGGKRAFLQLMLASCLAVTAVGTASLAFARSHERGESKKQKAEEPAPPAGPLFFVISTGKQHVSVYGNNGLYTRSPVSTGRPDHPTPLGFFTIIGKERYHNSNIYSGAPMPFMQRITWSGVAMHEGILPGYAASHGCVRMPHDFARRLFGYTQGIEHVVIARQDIVPEPISHPRLPVPKLMTIPGSENIASGSAQMLQNAIATAQNPNQMVNVAVTPDAGAPLPATPQQKLLNPIEFAKAMKARAAKKVEEAGTAINSARGAADAKAKEAKDAAVAVRKAEITLSNAKDRFESAESQLKKVSGDEAIKAAEAAKAEAEAKVKDAEALLASATSTKFAKEHEASAAIKAINEAGNVRKTAADAIKSWERRLAPISVFISRKTQRLYVRQGFLKVFDVPVTIRDPEKPLGTHLFIALRPDQSGQAEPSLRWVVLTVPDGGAADEGESRKRRRHRNDEDDAPRTAPAGVSASQALDRIEVPAEVEGKISEMLWAGGSLLVSDRPMSGETGDHTDFVILTR